jgi:hypothetical protein
MPNTTRAVATMVASAHDKLRSSDAPSFRLLPVANKAIDGWNVRVQAWMGTAA